MTTSARSSTTRSSTGSRSRGGSTPTTLRTTSRRIGGQFGSLAGRRYIAEVERRKSSVPTRKGAKSGVYVFTTKGRAQLVGHRTVDGGNGGPVSGEPAQSNAGVPEPRGPGGMNVPSCTGTEQSESASGVSSPQAPDASPEPIELLPAPDPKAWAA